MAAIASSIVGGLGSLFGGIFGASSAHSAANNLSSAAINAGSEQSMEDTTALQGFQGQAPQISSTYSPYMSAGTSSLTAIQNSLGNGSLGGTYQGYQAPAAFQAPTLADAQNNPGYQFNLQQGLGALGNQSTTNGQFGGGNEGQALVNYAQNAATNNYQQVYNNALNSYNTNAQTGLNAYNTNAGNYYTGQQNLSSILGNLTNTGLNASNSFTNATSANLGQQSGLEQAIGQANGNAYINSAMAQAGGTIGATNAMMGGMGGATNSLQQILTSLGQSGYGAATMPGGYQTYG